MVRNIFLFVTIIFVITAGGALAKDVALTWDASDDPNVAGYRIHYKTGSPDGAFDGTLAEQGPSPIDVGLSLTTTLSGLDSDVYFFAVTAYDNWGNESEFSNVIASHWIPTGNFPGNFASLSPGKVDFIWTAPPAEAGIVSYKLIYGTDPAALPAALAGLTYPSTTLFAGFSFLALAGIGMKSRKRLRHFLPAVIVCSLFLVSGCGGGGGSSDSRSGSDPGLGDATAQVITDIPVNSHSVYDLKASTTYYWQVVAVDTAGEELESPVYSFTTEAL